MKCRFEAYLPDDLSGRVTRDTKVTSFCHITGTEDVNNVVDPVNENE